MVAPLLATKLFIPPTRPGLVLRQRLLDKLESGISYRLVLISAPPGFGKSTLRSEWANRTDRCQHITGVSLDEADDDPVRFWVLMFQSDINTGET